MLQEHLKRIQKESGMASRVPSNGLDCDTEEGQNEETNDEMKKQKKES